MAGVVGIEPTTSGFGDQRSATELYPFIMVGREGIEPTSRDFQSPA